MGGGFITPEKSNSLEYTKIQYRDSSNLTTRVQLHDRFSTNKYGWIPWVFDQLRLQANSMILELGCGGGGLWVRNLDRIPENCEILLTDHTEGMVRDAQRNLADNTMFELKILDANDQPLPFGNATFDIVIANHMVNYISDRQGLFSEIVRMLKPHGRFYTSTIGKQHNVEIPGFINEFDPVVGVSWGKVSDPFNLENGVAQLSPWFTNISLRRYEDAFEITEVEPLVDYILSGGLIDWGEDQQDQFKELIKQKMVQQGGVLHITKDSGIFECIKE